MLSPNIASVFGLVDDRSRMVEWMKLVQENARAVSANYRLQGYSGYPDEFLSDKLGYTKAGYRKSMVKYLDEYYWLTCGDHLEIPPSWVPSRLESPTGPEITLSKPTHEKVR